MASSVKRGSLMEETIEVKPSIELIADEYEHFERSKRGIILHTFASDVSEDKHNEELFLKTISKYGYQISAENRHSLDQDNLGKIIVDIIGKCRKDDAGIILFFSGPVNKLGYLDTSKIENNMNIQDIWLPFNSHNCLPLKNKPKIFIFDLSIPQPPIQTDGTRRINNQISSYDTPAEADILIIYNKTEEYDDNYMEHFCENIKEYAETENIITLASCTGALTTPIIISTLTKKFYLADSELRGHHFIIDKHHREINNHVQDIKVALGKTGTEKTKKLGFFQSIRERMSKDSDSSKNTSTKNSTTSVNSTSTNTSTVTDNKASATAAAAGNYPARRPSGPSVPRNRGLSESDTGRQSARRLSENRRPPWRN